MFLNQLLIYNLYYIHVCKVRQVQSRTKYICISVPSWRLCFCLLMDGALVSLGSAVLVVSPLHLLCTPSLSHWEKRQDLGTVQTLFSNS